MNRGTVRKSLALAAIGSLALAACSTSTSDDEGGDDQGATFTYGYEQEIDAYNNQTAGSNASKNSIVLNRVVLGFWRYGAAGELDPEEEFGSYEKVSDDPLTVEYTFADEAVWSDGEPIDCDDAQLQYVANAGIYPEFDPAGTTGYSQMESVECSDGDKQFTVTYDTPFADWASMFNPLMPAHVAEREAGVDDLLAVLDDPAEMAKIGDFWTDGWVFQPGVLPDEALIPSSGPYKISSWEGGQSITLVANDAWWGTPPQTETVVIRFIAQDGQAQALENGEIQAMDPQPTPDLAAQLEALGDSVVVETADQFTWEHLDFNFGVEKLQDPRVRQAFALCVPRTLLVDNLIKPQNPEAIVQNSRYFQPFQSAYSEVVEQLPIEQYAETDVEGAAALLAEADATGMDITIGYIAGNQRRAEQFALIKASCDEAGFNIIDGVSPTFFDDGGELDSGNFDVAMFAWAGSPLVSGSSSTYITDGGNNEGNYSNAEVDALLAELDQTADQDAQQDLIVQIETILWNDLATIPLFTFPGLLAYSSNAQGVVFNASQGGLTWNMEDWALE
jgi:peptide/nickel transport system substrate-binding protein